GYLRPALDIEGSAYNLSTTALTDWVIAFINEVVAQRGPSAEPIVYTTLPATEFDSRMASYDLWIRSTNGQNPQTGSPTTTGQFGNWLVWQYDVAPAGGLSSVDLD